MPPPELGRREVIGLKEDFKPCAFAKPGGQEFGLVTIKDFLKGEQLRQGQTMLDVSKQAGQQHVKQKKLWYFVL